MSTSELFLRDVIDIKEDVHAGDFKVELSGGFTETDARVAEYVVTDQLQEAFKRALGLVGAAVRTGSSHAAYLHGSFGAGKSHFLTVLHAVLNNHAAARRKPRLQEVIAEHDDWLRQKKFLMVPFHLVGSTDLDSALLGGYVATVRRLHPDQPTPAVYRADAAITDARRQREFLADDGKFVQWLGSGGVAVAPSGAVAGADDEDDLDTSGLVDTPSAPAPGAWTSADLDHAFAAPAGAPLREALVSALLSGPMSAYAIGARGDKDAFVPLENGLSVVSRHAQALGYDGIVLFLDELILWLQAHMGEQDFVRDQVQKLVKLIESGDSDRPVPVVSFISRQRDLSQLIGSDVAGAEVQNLEQQVEYLAGRIDVVDLEDSNLIEIIKHRVLAPKQGMEAARESAFAAVESSKDEVRQVLLDAHGRTEASWDDFRDVYPLSPAFLNVLVELSGALQRERTGLKLVQETLRRRRDDLKLGELIPLGDLWDVILDGTGEAFTARLRKEAETAKRFHDRVVAHLLEKYGSADSPLFKGDERLIKTLLLAALAPNVPALARLTGERLAALNHGSIKVRLGSAGSVAVKRLKELQGEFGELRSEGSADPVFHLHLSDLDIEPLLDEVSSEDNLGKRRQWVKDQLWSALGIGDAQAFVSEREVVWRGTKRAAEFVFGNVCDPHLPDEQFKPQMDGNIRFVLDYPFDDSQRYPVDDVRRVERIKQEGKYAPTVVWLPDFFSEQKSNQLGRLLKINYLLERDRLDDHTATKSADERVQIRHQLKAQSENLTSQLAAVLQQLYGISKPDPGSVGAEVPDNQHVWSLEPAYSRPRPQAGLSFEQNLYALADGMFAALYPKHPDFDPALTRKAVTTRELKTALEWIGKAMTDGSRRVVVDRHHLPIVKRVVHPLGLGEVHDGPLNLLNDWRLKINQKASEAKAGTELSVEDIRRWIGELGFTGLEKNITSLIIATYALLDDRTWVFQTTPVPAPELERIGRDYGLRAVELPSEEEFTTARARAGAIFGVSAQPVLFARNVAALESHVRDIVEAHQQPVGGARRSLEKHGDDLGLAGAEADRMRSMRAAADLLARLSRTKDATSLVRELAAASYDVTDQELGAAIKQAPEVLEALDNTNWSLLKSVRGFAERGDGVGDKAERLITSLRETVNDHEQARSLVPVLSRLQDQSVALVTEAARLANIAQPTPEPTPGPDDVSLTRHGDPVVRSNIPPQLDFDRDEPAARSVKPVPGPTAPHVLDTQQPTRLESALAAAVADVRDEIRSYVEAHPGVRIEIAWRPVSADQRAADEEAES